MISSRKASTDAAMQLGRRESDDVSVLMYDEINEINLVQSAVGSYNSRIDSLQEGFENDDEDQSDIDHGSTNSLTSDESISLKQENSAEQNWKNQPKLSEGIILTTHPIVTNGSQSVVSSVPQTPTMGPAPALPLPPNPKNSPPKIRSLPDLVTSIKTVNSPLPPQQQPPLSPRVVRNPSQDIYQRQQQQPPQYQREPLNQITRQQIEEIATLKSKESNTTKQPPSRLNSGSQTLFSKTNTSVKINQNKTSMLTSLISESISNDNPFAKEFAFFSGKGVLDAIRLKIYLPFSESPDKPILIVIRPDATIDDVIGYTLFEYLNEKRLPKVPSNLSDISLWTMRIVEDDGSIDQDFPALERTRRVQRFAFDKFALCESIPGQVKTYILAAKSGDPHLKGSPGSQTPSIAPASPSVTSKPTNNISANNTVFFLKIHLYSTIEVKQTTTVQMPGSTLLSEVFEHVCKKRKYDPRVYVLKMPDTKTDVPLGKTLDQLKVTEFCVLKKDSVKGDLFVRPPDEVKDEPFMEQPRFITPDEYSNINIMWLTSILWDDMNDFLQ
ncbi:hypothetical protein HK096_001977 [Nowakowskiella sp. JEL0078]|nr:hypothetical protein HK096_001977 [Nowakowskiella sp. JEL0078]